MTLVIDDFVMLGKTVPEPNSDGRVFVCSAGYSPTLRSLVRIYPLSRYDAPKRWTVSTVQLERNPKDFRRESFQIAGDRSLDQHDRINSLFTVTGTVGERQRAELLKPYVVGSIKDANERLLSLAVVHPDAMELTFEHNPDSPDSPELTLFDLQPREEAGARRFPYIPRLRFRDGHGENNPMLRDWGVYELMRKHNNLIDMNAGERTKFVSTALHLDGTCSLLVGNFNRHRNRWLVISVLRGLRDAPSLLDLLDVAA